MAPDPTILIVEKGLLNPRSATLALPSPADFPALKNALSELFRLMGSEAILRREEGSQRPVRSEQALSWSYLLSTSLDSSSGTEPTIRFVASSFSSSAGWAPGRVIAKAVPEGGSGINSALGESATTSNFPFLDTSLPVGASTSPGS